MTTEFLDASASIVDAIMDGGDMPESVELTSALYRHLPFPEGQPRQVYERTLVPETLFGCDVWVEPGAHHGWKIRTAAGELWDASGRRVYG